MADYPRHLERSRRLADGRTVVIRPIRPDDEPHEREFFDHLSGDARRRRFMKYAGAVSAELVHFHTHIDYDRHMAFVCEAGLDGERRLVGDARYVANPDARSCELGIVVAEDWRHTGVARLLMEALIHAARARGLATMEGLVLSDNADMLGFARGLGFEILPMPERPDLLRIVRQL